VVLLRRAVVGVELGNQFAPAQQEGAALPFEREPSAQRRLREALPNTRHVTEKALGPLAVNGFDVVLTKGEQRDSPQHHMAASGTVMRRDIPIKRNRRIDAAVKRSAGERESGERGQTRLGLSDDERPRDSPERWPLQSGITLQHADLLGLTMLLRR